MSKKTSTARLDRLLANMGYGSRREIQQLARGGRILLDGEAVTSAEQRLTITPDLAQRLRLDDQPLDPLPGMIMMINKPLGVTCSRKEAGPLVYGLLPERWRRRDPALSTIGRLDKETSGLLLMTDDGALLHRIISPKHHVSKRYLVMLDRPLKGNETDIVASGALMLEGEDKPLKPAIVEPITETSAHITVTEGRYHQVRRMFAAMGNHVTALHRDRIGGLELPDDLAPGEFRLMGDADIAAIFSETSPPPEQ